MVCTKPEIGVLVTTCRVPSLAGSHIVIRLARDAAEIEAANRLVYGNYVNLYWPEDEKVLQHNKYFSSPVRHAAVAKHPSRVLATLSAIEDSPMGLPSDTFQPQTLLSLRKGNMKIAEMTSFAVARSAPRGASLPLYLMKFFMQYCFYYLGVDRLVASCRPRHANFYADVLCFDKLGDPLPHPYAGGMKCQLVTLDLLQAHVLLNDRYEAFDGEENLYRFFYLDGDPNVLFPQDTLPRRPPDMDWIAIASRQVLPVTV